MTPAVTDWIPGDQKPTIVGVYEREVFNVFGEKILAYSRWKGGEWYSWCLYIEDANRCFDLSGQQNVPWRGLASDPKGTK